MLFSFPIPFGRSPFESYIDLYSRLPLYCRTIVESRSRRARDANYHSCVRSSVVPRHCRGARSDPSHVRLCCDFGPPRRAVGGAGHWTIRKEWLAHRGGVYPQRFDHGSNAGFRRDSNGSDGRPCCARGRRGGDGRELRGGGAEYNAHRDHGDGVTHGRSQRQSHRRHSLSVRIPISRLASRSEKPACSRRKMWR